ncbi:MAG: TrmB family transcriptional regulator [Halobacteriota archaeon]
MSSEHDFITHLIGFGLTEKEAQCYFYLLRYGPKTPSPLAKSLHTYREDVHRTLQSLIEKGMVRPSLDLPTLYTAVELETALDSALKKHEAELREMGQRKQELEALAQQQSFRPSDEVSTFKIIKNVKELVSVGLASATAAEKEMLVVSSREIVALASLFGVNNEVKRFIERGGTCKTIFDIPYSMIDVVREMTEIGEEVRHYGPYSGVFFASIDRKICFHAINVDMGRISLSQPLSMLYTDDPTYAGYLVGTFEMLWKQAIPAEQHIEELLKQGPPQTDQL